MGEESLTQLQAQIEALRHEAFAEGYAEAMKAVHQLASRSVPQQRNSTAALDGTERVEDGISQPKPSQAAIPLRTATPVRRSSAKRFAANGTCQSRGGRAKRGTNARMVQEILKRAAPRAMRQAEIRRALQDKGTTLSYPSIGHSLGQLVSRNAARQVGNSKTWRYREA